MHLEYNYKYDCIVDPYTYSGTAILRNKFNIRDSSVLSKVERRITEAKLVLLQTRQLPRGHYDLKHLQAMHKYLCGDIYDWAGEIRSAGFISKGQSIFCHSDFIVPYAQSLFSRMHREDFKGMTKELFVVFFGANKIIARMTILLGYHTAVYKKNRPARRSVFCGSCKIRVKRQTARDERCIPNEYPRFWSPIRPGGEGLASGA